MSKAGLIALGEANLRLVQGQDPAGFLEEFQFFLKNSHLWKQSEGVLLPLAELTRIFQAYVVWQKLGAKVFGVSLPKYLYGTDKLAPVPSLPTWPEACGDTFDRDVLVDGRIVEKVGITELCELLGLAYDGNHTTPVPHDAKQRVQSGIRWMRFQDGRRNHGRKPDDCRKTYKPFEVGMDVVEGTAVYVQDSWVIKDHYMDLTASVRADDRGYCAALGIWSDGPLLSWRWHGSADPHCGAASRGKLDA
ncbi:hypothetical protein HY625_01450 [Candidatus Uhrbacteria bacterium]|nr:hypothetical protein [Candidatus Uhrbacteria bacterium]